MSSTSPERVWKDEERIERVGGNGNGLRDGKPRKLTPALS